MHIRQVFSLLILIVLGTGAAALLEGCLCAECYRRADGGGGSDGSTDGGARGDTGPPMRPDSGRPSLDAGCFLNPMTGGITCQQPRDGGPGSDRDGGNTSIPLPTNGSAATLTKDDAVAMVLTHYYGHNATPGSVGIAKYNIDFENSAAMFNGSDENLGEAYQAILAQDFDTGYIAASGNQPGGGLVYKFGHVANPTVQPMLIGSPTQVGAEPRGLALTPSGNLLYVANWSDGTVTVLNTSDMSVKSTIDLNTPLAQSGMLGPSVMNQNPARPALAHPWAIAVTDHGNMRDEEERVYVTEYFSQALTSTAGIPSDDRQWDLGRQGVVYTFDVATETVGPLITLAAQQIADRAFVDSNNFTTGCFPNLLNSATIHNGRLFVTATCDSPRGPVGPVVDPSTGDDRNTNNFKTLVHPAIYQIDLTANAEIPAQSLLLDVAWQRAYDHDGVPDDNTRRMPLIPSDIAFEPGTDNAYITAYGADALFRISYNADGTLNRVGAAATTSTGTPSYYIDLGIPGTSGRKPAHLPRGLAISRAGHRAIVVNDHTRNISFVDLDNQRLIKNVDMNMNAASGTEAQINDGHRYFATGLGRYSFRGQAWSSCESCHPSGLTDNVTWFLPVGPRQTLSLDLAFGTTHVDVTRFFTWGANADEIHDFEMYTRRISGGVGAIVYQVSDPPVNADRIVFAGEDPIPPGQMPALPIVAPLKMQRNDWINGSTSGLMPGSAGMTISAISDWNSINSYARAIHHPRAPSNLNQNDVAQGQNVYLSSNCIDCHGGEQWTISRRFYAPNQINNDPFNGALLGNYMAAMTFPRALNPATDNPMRSATLRSPGDMVDLSTIADPEIYCVLRAVGTFPAQPDPRNPNKAGISVAGVNVREVRSDMTTLAQGLAGYNPPPISGAFANAPYFHAGNARTLEEVFSDTFHAHANAFVFTGSFPGPGDRNVLVRQLVAYLLSIDGYLMTSDPMLSLAGFDPLLCPLRFGM